MKNLTLIFLLLALISCNEDSNDKSAAKQKNDHIWKTQTDALQDAKDLAEQLNEQFKKKSEQMEQAKE
jgi:hypothetical protein